jgi:hypothetical protein
MKNVLESKSVLIQLFRTILKSQKIDSECLRIFHTASHLAEPLEVEWSEGVSSVLQLLFSKRFQMSH